MCTYVKQYDEKKDLYKKGSQVILTVSKNPWYKNTEDFTDSKIISVSGDNIINNTNAYDNNNSNILLISIIICIIVMIYISKK